MRRNLYGKCHKVGCKIAYYLQSRTDQYETKRAPCGGALNLARRGIEPLVSSVKGRRLNRSTNGPRGIVYPDVFPQARFELIQSSYEFTSSCNHAPNYCGSIPRMYSQKKSGRGQRRDAIRRQGSCFVHSCQRNH